MKLPEKKYSLLAVSIVFFNPTESAVNKILEYARFFDQVYVIDNSNVENQKMLSIANTFPKIRYFPLHKNTGIAHALNIALTLAQRNNVAFLCTMDQDSVFPFSQFSEIKRSLQFVDFSSDAIIAMTPNFQKETKQLSIEDKQFVITSGNFLNIRLLAKKKIEFSDDLFIDYVDFDFCHKIHQAHLNIKQYKNFQFEHTLGNPITCRFLGWQYTSMNHSPIRDYYRYRNMTFLYLSDKKYFRKLRQKEMTIELLKILLGEKNRYEKFKMIRQGIRDGKHGRLGPYQDSKK